MPRIVRLALMGTLLLGYLIWRIPVLWMSNEEDGRVQVVTFIAGLGAVVLALVVAARLGIEAARQREGLVVPGQKRGSKPEKTTLSVPGVDLREAALPAANLTGVELTKARLDDADLRKATLADSRLEGANLRRTDLTEATLDGARLEEADLRGADLRGASLKQASLNKARLDGALYDRRTKWPRGVRPAERGAVEVARGGR